MLPTTPPLTQPGTGGCNTWPEQIEGNEAHARTDSFTFGAVLYEILTGKKAFDGKSQASLIRAIMRNEPAPISSEQSLTPSVLDRIVKKKCLAKEPDKRWQSAKTLCDELKWVTAVNRSHDVPRLQGFGVTAETQA
jgi:serine/threonine protein kinase